MANNSVLGVKLLSQRRSERKEQMALVVSLALTALSVAPSAPACLLYELEAWAAINVPASEEWEGSSREALVSHWTSLSTCRRSDWGFCIPHPILTRKTILGGMKFPFYSCRNPSLVRLDHTVNGEGRMLINLIISVCSFPVSSVLSWVNAESCVQRPSPVHSSSSVPCSCLLLESRDQDWDERWREVTVVMRTTCRGEMRTKNFI